MCLGLLTSCTVPQIIQGRITPSPTPTPTVSASGLSLQQGYVALATRMITVSQEAGRLLQSSRDISLRLQQIQNFVFFNVKQTGSGLAGWGFANSLYSRYDVSRGNQLSLAFEDSQGKAYSWDLLETSNYGETPRPAKAFPQDAKTYTLTLSKPSTANEGTILMAAKGTLPGQIPLQGDFTTTFSGTGNVDAHPYLSNFSYRLDGTANTLENGANGQLSFQTTFQKEVYNGFGRVDAQGFTGTVTVQNNGRTVAEIERQGDLWAVKIDGRVVATGQ